MSKKIGILTWFYAKNYGARAHSLALYNTLKEFEYDVEFINYKPYNVILNDIRDVVSRNPKSFTRNLVQLCYMYSHPLEVKVSGYVHNAREISKLDYDYIILGSDEIFNVLHPCFSEIYMGVGLEKFKIITYAVSSGQNYLSNMPDKCKKAISEIRYISVRDHYTQDFIKRNTGRDSVITIDPTLLIDSNCEKTKRLVQEEYLLIYAFSALDDKKNNIIEFARSSGLIVVRIGSIPRKGDWVDKEYTCLSLNEWKSMFKYASVVVTDSFHGSIFALKNKKKIVLINRNEKMDKISSLFEDLDIVCKTYDNNIYDTIISPQYDVVEKKIKLLREKSIQFLGNALC